jgi:hypothetical protein
MCKKISPKNIGFFGSPELFQLPETRVKKIPKYTGKGRIYFPDISIGSTSFIN